MAEDVSAPRIPTSEKTLRELARDASKTLPNFAEKESAIGVKELHEILNPVLETADLPDLAPGHRAAASNALCAIIEVCQASAANYAREEILDDSIWLRILEIYLQRSDNAKSKAMRQILMVLTNVVMKNESPRALQLRQQATITFLDIICDRQDRIKVKPALQGLAHFLLRETVSIPQLVELYEEVLARTNGPSRVSASSQTLFRASLAWIVHHDTSLSAGHLVKNFLIQARKSPDYLTTAPNSFMSPLWIEPVVQTLRDWPERMQEFKTHVFPHCFLPNIDEYMRFLSYLHFSTHIKSSGLLPEALRTFEERSNGLDKAEEFRVLLAAIEAGKELTIIRDSDHRFSDTIKVHDGAIHLPDNIFGLWMGHADSEVRLAGMFLSVYSTAITRPMTSGVFRSLKKNLVHLHTDTDANFRREINEYTQKLFDRLRASTATLAKKDVKKSGSEVARLPIPKACLNQGPSPAMRTEQDPLLESLSFVVWYIRLLEWELRSTASYQRRVTALQSLMIVLRSGIDPGVPFSHLSKSAQGQLNWAHGIQLANDKLIRVLMDLILDPFDDIRNSAISVLQLCLLAQPLDGQNAVLASMHRFLDRAANMQLRTGRADQADGVARAYSLLYSLLDSHPGPSNPTIFASSFTVYLYLTRTLRNTLSYAYESLTNAVNGRPIHSTFAALRYIIDQDQFYQSLSRETPTKFQQWREAHDEILKCVEDFWGCIQHILCADAPEGLVPDEIEEEASLDTKEILSYSWRGLKEASVLLRVMISKAPIGDDEHALISPGLFEKLGRLCFTQLLELRHRGAFSTVSQTFAAFCRRCVSSNVPALRALPEIWYQETFRSMQDKAGAITRRSAGIPALMASIMAADTNNLFPRAVRELIAEASLEAKSTNIEESRLPQVHALNCIKEFFMTSRLNVASEAYMGQGLELAAKTLNSNIWPIRNCSLMLFKALIERLLGSSEAQDWKERDRAKTSRFSYDNYPSLVGMLSDLLDPEGPLRQSIESTPDSSSPLDLHGAEGVFPALQILRQAQPPDDTLEPIIASVEKLLRSPHWHLRDMAARTIVSLRPVHQLHTAASRLLAAASGSYNLQHGTLLAVKYMMRKLLQDSTSLNLEDLGDLMKELSQYVGQWYASDSCHFVRAAFLDVVSICGMTMLRRPGSTIVLHTWELLTNSVSIGPQYNLGVRRSAGEALLRQSLAQIFFVDRIILRDNSLGLMVSKEYQSIGDALMLLAIDDQDACCTALTTLNTILKLKSPNSLAIPLDLVLAHVHRVLLNAADSEVISTAQAVLAEGLTDDTLRIGFFSLLTEEQAMRTLIKLESQCLEGPPSNLQSAVHLLGYFLDFAYNAYKNQQHAILKAIARYTRLLRMTIIDTNPFDTRFAAVQSLNALSHIWSAATDSKTTGPLILALTFILYDLLNDDDDEIRDLAALATANILHSAPTVPVLTTHRLATYLSRTFATSPYLVQEATSRLTQPTASFATQLSQARQEDSSLFATEKQNLYKDDTLDALFWSRILSLIQIPTDTLSNLTAWALDALSVLTQTATSEIDGALGWSSKPDVFTLGVRVMCVAEVVVRDERVLLALRRFADVCKEKEGHGLWCERMERVLERGVARILGSVTGDLGEFEEYI